MTGYVASVPDGQITELADRGVCPAPFAKILSFPFEANHLHISRHPGPHRGAFRDRHERRAGDAVDAGDVKRRMTLRADGEVVWS
jgi:hypothetical protein